MHLTDKTPEEAPVNDPKEFLSFCGACGLGALGAVLPSFFEKALSRLKELATDPRWRLREAVAMALQRLIETQSEATLKELEGWIATGDWLAMRAVAAGVAEPTVLKDRENAQKALELLKTIFDQILSEKERKSEEFITLRKGLGYTLSVVVAAIPDEGFEYMHHLVEMEDTDIQWILKENLKKNRLLKTFPEEVASLKQLLE
jgi:hypothetical protein